jgi:ABC-2 type transport system permease protein
MRAFIEILKFEIRFHLTSPFLWGAAFFFALVHFVTVGDIFIGLGENRRIALNGAGKIIQILSTYNYLAMIPAVVFVARAIIRDYDTSTASFFFVTPVRKLHFLLGRFAGAFAAILIVGLASVVGTLTGTYNPSIDETQLGKYTYAPYLFAVVAILLPNYLMMTAFFFAAAALTRSLAVTAAVAMIFISLGIFLSQYPALQDIRWTAMVDPFGVIAIQAETRYWTVPELNSNLPVGTLFENRLLWLAVASGVLVVAFRRFQMALPEGGRKRWPFRVASLRPLTEQPPLKKLAIKPSFAFRDTVAQFASQLRMDIAATLKSPLIYILMLLAALTTMGDFYSHANVLSGQRYYPYTSLMLEHFHYGYFPFVMMIVLYYAGALLYRESDACLSEIVGASPCPDGVVLLAKTAAMVFVVIALSLIVMAVSIALQAAAGWTDFEIGLYLKSLFVHNGTFYVMFCILAVAIQALVGNKWLGMGLTFAAIIGLLSLGSLGVEHILFRFSIPYSLYSDMNGYGPAAPNVYSLIVYWGFFCVLLLLAAHVVFPRASSASLRDRLREARARITSRLVATAISATAAFICAGVWIFYNTNVLNEYRSTEDEQRMWADYERNVAQYIGAPAPSFLSINTEVDFFPQERRIESRGTATLRNNKGVPIREFVMTLDPRMHVNELEVASATLALEDARIGFRRYTLVSPLAPGKSVEMTWDMTLHRKGFVNANHDYEIVENGIFVTNELTIPIPGVDSEKFIADPAWRNRLGLPPVKRLPDLGDPEYIGVLKFGIDSTTDYRAVVSTALDQIAVTQGELKREWTEEGRRYFEYVTERPIWPAISVNSARYKVTRDAWNDVALEVYYHPKHGRNVDAMLVTVKRAMDYMAREFAPYPYSTFKIIEYPRYSAAAKAFPGAAIYPENYGFITDNSNTHNLDYGTIHEFAHQWWGVQAYGARMQGRQLLNEGLAQYSTLMIFRENFGPDFAARLARDLHDGYLNARSDETAEELPLMYTDDQGYISYNKGPLAFYALADVIGESQVNRALRNYLAKFALNGAPFPTSRDLVNELREVAGTEHQLVITDLFEKIVLYDLRIDDVNIQPTGGAYDVTINLTAQKFEADGYGQETEVPLDADVEIAVRSDNDDMPSLHFQKHRLKSGPQKLTIQVNELPKSIEIDPLYKRIDRTRQDNIRRIDP